MLFHNNIGRYNQKPKSILPQMCLKYNCKISRSTEVTLFGNVFKMKEQKSRGLKIQSAIKIKYK
ncbi:hypothetical protein AAJ76_247000887 [Vairimorpha ceranae]|uniref:Uncharacterized protein n=1 Tax=Vairimorpha ceranae TaxID=40302 RepID=A0A0F9W9W0_9MICR|nr:hypothetical protein AAJ76_247000887 [Vairimorpha ceranae]KKO73760.1 hypothetical protein AAJ76_247000887 [Vairimorpha ceranae]